MISILWIDDDEFYRNVISTVFDAEYDLWFADSVEKGLELIKSRNADIKLVICDYLMPLSMKAEIMCNYCHKHDIPFVYHTSYWSMMKAKTFVIPKQIPMNQLRSRINILIEGFVR